MKPTPAVCRRDGSIRDSESVRIEEFHRAAEVQDHVASVSAGEEGLLGEMGCCAGWVVCKSDMRLRHITVTSCDRSTLDLFSTHSLSN